MSHHSPRGATCNLGLIDHCAVLRLNVGFKKTSAGVNKLNITAGHMTAGAGSSNKAAIAASANTGHPQSGATVSILNINIDTNTDNATLPATTKLGCSC